jgi:hypothetical protein
VVQLFKKGVPLDKQTAPTETNVGGEGMDATVPVPDKPSVSETMVTLSGKWKLDDGQSYSTDEINTALLKSIGYSKKRAAEVIKLICKPSIN